MLYGLRIDIPEVVQMGVIMIHIRYCREVQTRNAVLDDSEVRKVRHETIDHRCQRICVRVFRCILVEFHHLAVAWAGLEQKGWPLRAASLYIHHKTHIIKHFPIILPHSLHPHHAHFLGIRKKYLQVLFPLRTLLDKVRYALQYDAHSVSVIGCTIGPHRIPSERLRITRIIMSHKKHLRSDSQTVSRCAEISEDIAGVESIFNMSVLRSDQRIVLEKTHRISTQIIQTGYEILSHRGPFIWVGNRMVFL